MFWMILSILIVSGLLGLFRSDQDLLRALNYKKQIIKIAEEAQRITNIHSLSQLLGISDLFH